MRFEEKAILQISYLFSYYSINNEFHPARPGQQGRGRHAGSVFKSAPGGLASATGTAAGVFIRLFCY
ncbi:hypothetical protein CVD23_14070, partial [Bacillus sp. V33-4]